MNESAHKTLPSVVANTTQDEPVVSRLFAIIFALDNLLINYFVDLLDLFLQHF